MCVFFLFHRCVSASSLSHICFPFSFLFLSILFRSSMSTSVSLLFTFQIVVSLKLTCLILFLIPSLSFAIHKILKLLSPSFPRVNLSHFIIPFSFFSLLIPATSIILARPHPSRVSPYDSSILFSFAYILYVPLFPSFPSVFFPAILLGNRTIELYNLT